MDQKFLARKELQRLLDALQREGYSLRGPRLRQGAIVYDSFENVEQLPTGLTDTQQPGHYSVQKTDSLRLFSWAAAAQSVKPFSFVPVEKLWQSSVSADNRLNFSETLPTPEPVAIIGVRACDLAALDLQDKHFLQQEYVDPYYEQRRQSLFLVAVNCSHPAETCFCHATGDGPAVSQGFDLSLTEFDEGYLIGAGSVRAQVILDELNLADATESQLRMQAEQNLAAIDRQSRKLPECDIVNVLKIRQDHNHWDDIGQRCLACGNCTAVCPSCFCHSEHDESSLGSSTVDHVRQWDSCFNHNHSYIHGIVIRPESKTRYRQWMTHKFSSWVEQYGRSGCTGCGRCITWCPVGIDVVQELNTLCGESDD